jgi:uncharacterized protein (DUF1800 family)
LILNQNKTERQYAVGKFDDLVVKISQDPAMLYWLDNWLSRDTRPNENYARELMELFALGVDNYTQTDVTEVARALTGWTIQGYTQADGYNGAFFVDNAAFHDNGSKTILGQTGNWNQLDAIRIILNYTDARGSVSGRFIGGKLALRWWGLNPRKAQATLLPVLMIVPSTSMVRRGNLSRSISS